MASNTKKVVIALWITLFTMVVEIYFGYVTGSMALLADGWHMASHTAALAITFVVYKLAVRSDLTKNFNFGGGKIIALGGFASSLFLIAVVVFMAIESTSRFFAPVSIQYKEALLVATLGLFINLICAFILRDTHTHDHGHEPTHTHDHNIRGAYIHVLADAVTSVAAILGLLMARYFGWVFLDPLIGIIGSLVILKWAISLLKDTGWELLDGHAKNINYLKLKKQIEASGVRIIDLHVWKIAPNVLTCELVVLANQAKGTEHYRHILQNDFDIYHSVIEERLE